MRPTALVLLLLSITSCIVRNKATQAKFVTPVKREHLQHLDLLIERIDKAVWVIGYRYGADCKPEERRNDIELKKAMTTALQAWLHPLQKLKPAPQTPNDFRYVLQPDFNGDHLANFKELQAMDTRITFECRLSFSSALLSAGTPPDIYMRRGTKVSLPFLSTLIHELGHAFGLGDAYVLPNVEGRMSTGGLEQTVGKQPSSIMASISNAAKQPPYLGEDDRRGILWLYKFFHTGLAIENCFFADYVLEKEPRGCRPKYPLIFEVKHAQPSTLALKLLDEDPTIDINTQDDGGFTALHYAVIREDEELVKGLLAHKNIKPFLLNKQGRSALQLARHAKLNRIVALLLTHPLTETSKASGKQITTWGKLKQEP